MKDKLSVGMFIRTPLGIDKIECFNKENVIGYGFITKAECYLLWHKEGNEFSIDGECFDKEDIKASYDIIDLIEEDDLIKCQFGEQTLILQVGARYTTSNPENGFVKGVFTPDNEFLSLEVLVEEDMLQSIVTKQNFESMEYRLGDDK